MAKGYTLDELNKLPDAPKGVRGYTLDELNQLPSLDTEPKKTFGQKVSNTIQSIFPGKQLGNALGTSIAGITQSIKQGSLEPALQAGQENSSNYGRIVGDVAQIATQGVGAVLPGATTILGKGAQLGALGAANLTGQALADDKSSKDIFKSALIGGSIGFGLGVAGGAISKGINSLTTKAPGRIYDSAIKTGLQDNKLAVKYGGKTLGEELIDRGIKGGDKKLLTQAQVGLNKSEDRLQAILDKSDKTISRNELAGYFDDLISKKNSTPGLADDVEKLKNVLNEFPEEVPIAEANKIKRNIYNALGDVKFKIDPSLSTKQEAMKALAKGIKTEIENKTADEVGKGVVQNINKDLAVYGKLQDRMIDKIAKLNRSNLLGLGDYGTIGAGAVLGGAPGAIVAEVGKKVLGSTSVRTGTAVGLNKLGKVIDKIPADKAGKISKITLMKLINKLTNQPDQ